MIDEFTSFLILCLLLILALKKRYSFFNSCCPKVAPDNFCKLKKKCSQNFFRELSTLHTCRLPITHDNSNLKGKSKKVLVIGSSKKTARSKQKTLLAYKYFNHIYL